MSQEEKYKLALFAVIRNSSVMPQGIELGKTMHEINTMAVAVMAEIMEMCDYEKLKESYESGQSKIMRRNDEDERQKCRGLSGSNGGQSGEECRPAAGEYRKFQEGYEGTV